VAVISGRLRRAPPLRRTSTRKSAFIRAYVLSGEIASKVDDDDNWFAPGRRYGGRGAGHVE
jgi:hypothetical protein